MGIDKEKSWAK